MCRVLWEKKKLSLIEKEEKQQQLTRMKTHSTKGQITQSNTEYYKKINTTEKRYHF